MADQSVSLRNTSGDDILLYRAAGAEAHAVAADGVVTVPGVVLADEGDAYLIGPEGAELSVPLDPDVPERGTEPNPAVRAWPRATWAQVTASKTRKNAGDTEGDGDAER